MQSLCRYRCICCNGDRRNDSFLACSTFSVPGPRSSLLVVKMFEIAIVFPFTLQAETSIISHSHHLLMTLVSVHPLGAIEHNSHRWNAPALGGTRDCIPPFHPHSCFSQKTRECYYLHTLSLYNHHLETNQARRSCVRGNQI